MAPDTSQLEDHADTSGVVSRAVINVIALFAGDHAKVVVVSSVENGLIFEGGRECLGDLASFIGLWAGRKNANDVGRLERTNG